MSGLTLTNWVPVAEQTLDTCDDLLRALAASPPVPLPRFGPRFEVVRRLGQGGMGVVYEAFDRERGTLVALKTLTQLSAAGLYRLKTEFRSLAGVRHPNLVGLLELFVQGGACFFTMDLIEGSSFNSYVKRGAGGKALRDTLEQLTLGVQAIHRQQMLHRDLKPSNVLVTPDGRVVILDFGLVSEQSDCLGSAAKTGVAGTPAYMAPELVAGEVAGFASDWYAVGTMLFEALAGRLPFEVETAENAEAQRIPSPEPPSRYAENVPPELDALCLALLERDPERRADGARILDALGSDASRLAPLSSVRGGFVGRRAELAQFRRARAEVRPGVPTLLLVSGQSGIGKTELVRQCFSEAPGSKPPLRLAGRCYEREFIPFKAFDRVIDRLGEELRELPRERRACLSSEDWAALCRLFPTLRRVAEVPGASARIPAPGDLHSERTHAFGALRRLLRKLCESFEVSIFVDDMQWGDEDSAALLEELLRTAEPPPLLFVGCFRDDGAQSPLVERALELERRGGPLLVKRIALGPLSAAEASELASRLLGDEHDSSRSRAIASESRGLPYFVAELVRVTEHGQGLSGHSTSLADVILARIAALPAVERRLLEVIALAGRFVDAGTAARAAGIAAPAQALDGLLAARLVRAGTARSEVAVYHDRVAEAVDAALAPERCRTLCRALGDQVASSREPEPEWLCELYRRADQLELAAEQAILAGDRARDSLAFARAAEHYRFAVETLELGLLEQGALRAKLAAALASRGRGVEAAAEYTRAAELAADASAPVALRLEYERAAVEQLLTTGCMEEAETRLKRLLTALEIEAPRSSLSSLGWFLVYRARLRFASLDFEEREPEQVSQAQRLRIDALFTVVTGYALVDVMLGASMQARHLLEALRAGDRFQALRALSLEVAFLMSLGWRETTRERTLMALARRAAECAGGAEAQAYLALTGIGLFQRGRWEEAHAIFEGAERRQLHGNPVFSSIRMFAMHTFFMLGNLWEARQRFIQACAEAEERGDRFMVSCLRTCIGYYFVADDVDTARRSLAEALAAWPKRKVMDTQHWHAMVCGADLDLYLGDGEQAYVRLHRQLPELRQSHMLFGAHVRVYTRYTFARAAIARISQRPGERARLVAEARRLARQIAGEPDPWTRTLSSLITAMAENAAGRTERAVEALEASIGHAEASATRYLIAPARYRLGQLVGGGAGREQVAEAVASLKEHAVGNPARWVRCYVPGEWGSS